MELEYQCLDFLKIYFENSLFGNISIIRFFFFAKNNVRLPIKTSYFLPLKQHWKVTISLCLKIFQ